MLCFARNKREREGALPIRIWSAHQQDASTIQPQKHTRILRIFACPLSARSSVTGRHAPHVLVLCFAAPRDHACDCSFAHAPYCDVLTRRLSDLISLDGQSSREGTTTSRSALAAALQRIVVTLGY